MLKIRGQDLCFMTDLSSAVRLSTRFSDFG
nr:MAG TPA: hypothetical protein [Caudoviricetes sp.]